MQERDSLFIRLKDWLEELIRRRPQIRAALVEHSRETVCVTPTIRQHHYQVTVSPPVCVHKLQERVQLCMVLQQL
jgi:hypothetical protein